MSHNYEADPITTPLRRANTKPCDVVAMVGYLAVADEDDHYRLYKDHHFNRYIEIGPDTIKARFRLKDECRKGQSVVWLDATKCISVCEDVLVSTYQLQLKGAGGPADEDLAYEYPRR